MDPRPITTPNLATPTRRTTRQVIAWTSLAMVASIVLQFIVGG